MGGEGIGRGFSIYGEPRPARRQSLGNPLNRFVCRHRQARIKLRAAVRICEMGQHAQSHKGQEALATRPAGQKARCQAREATSDRTLLLADVERHQDQHHAGRVSVAAKILFGQRART
jgi:hypothetical protein